MLLLSFTPSGFRLNYTFGRVSFDCLDKRNQTQSIAIRQQLTLLNKVGGSSEMLYLDNEVKKTA